MTVTDILGSKRGTVDAMGSRLAAALGGGSSFNESSFTGSYVRLDPEPDVQVKVCANIDPVDGRLANDRYPQYEVLVFLSADEDRVEPHRQRILAAVPELELLGQRFLDTDGRIKVRAWLGERFGPPEYTRTGPPQPGPA